MTGCSLTQAEQVLAQKMNPYNDPYGATVLLRSVRMNSTIA